MTDLIDRYLATWNETDAGKRRALIDELFSADASYVDPMAEARGRDAIDATIAAAQSQFPGFVFTQAGPVDGAPPADPVHLGAGAGGSRAAGRRLRRRGHRRGRPDHDGPRLP
jgi:SnoaL-like domain